MNLVFDLYSCNLNIFSFEECASYTQKKWFDGIKYKFFCYLFGTIIIAPWGFSGFFFDFYFVFISVFFTLSPNEYTLVQDRVIILVVTLKLLNTFVILGRLVDFLLAVERERS